MFSPDDFRTLPASERHHAVMRLAVELGMGTVSASKRNGKLFIVSGNRVDTVEEWYLHTVVRSAISHALGVARW